jgi:hypothetical protein
MPDVDRYVMRAATDDTALSLRSIVGRVFAVSRDPGTWPPKVPGSAAPASADSFDATDDW